MKYSSDLNLGEGLCIRTSFHFPDSGLYLLSGFDFYLIYFEWRDTENQQYMQGLIFGILWYLKNQMEIAFISNYVCINEAITKTPTI